MRRPLVTFALGFACAVLLLTLGATFPTVGTPVDAESPDTITHMQPNASLCGDEVRVVNWPFDEPGRLKVAKYVVTELHRFDDINIPAGSGDWTSDWFETDQYTRLLIRGWNMMAIDCYIEYEWASGLTFQDVSTKVRDGSPRREATIEGPQGRVRCDYDGLVDVFHETVIVYLRSE